LPATVALETYYRLDGLLLPPPSAGLRVGPPGQRLADGRWLLTRLDPAELSSVLGLEQPLLERILRPDPADRIGYTRSLDVLSNTLPPEKHRGYAVQWFALAAAVAFVAVFLTFRRKAA
jgi:cytochrome oxidase assembly protein ShyY1